MLRKAAVETDNNGCTSASIRLTVSELIHPTFRAQLTGICRSEGGCRVSAFGNGRFLNTSEFDPEATSQKRGASLRLTSETAPMKFVCLR